MKKTRNSHKKKKKLRHKILDMNMKDAIILAAGFSLFAHILFFERRRTKFYYYCYPFACFYEMNAQIDILPCRYTGGCACGLY